MLIDVVHEALADADTALAEEFERIVIAAPGRPLPLTASCESGRMAQRRGRSGDARSLNPDRRRSPRAQRLASVAGGGDEGPVRLPRTK